AQGATLNSRGHQAAVRVHLEFARPEGPALLARRFEHVAPTALQKSFLSVRFHGLTAAAIQYRPCRACFTHREATLRREPTYRRAVFPWHNSARQILVRAGRDRREVAGYRSDDRALAQNLQRLRWRHRAHVRKSQTLDQQSQKPSRPTNRLP